VPYKDADGRPDLSSVARFLHRAPDDDQEVTMRDSLENVMEPVAPQPVIQGERRIGAEVLHAGHAVPRHTVAAPAW
jgi:predicted phage tail protein